MSATARVAAFLTTASSIAGGEADAALAAAKVTNSNPPSIARRM